jgi:hypothetical protein
MKNNKIQNYLKGNRAPENPGWRKFCVLLFLLFAATRLITAQTFDFSKVPGVVINHAPAPGKIFLGTPSLVILPDGTYISSHEIFGAESGTVSVYESKDKGKSWKKIAEFEGIWNGLYLIHDQLYSMGSDKQYNFTIRKSTDGGHTWTTPHDEKAGLLRQSDPEKGFHSSAVSVIAAKGRIWKPCEIFRKNGRWGNFEAMVMSAPEDADLLDAENWKTSTRMSVDTAWGKEYGCWLEGGAVLSPEGNVLNILRVDNRETETAAIMHVSENGETLSFNPRNDFIDFPGGCKRFVILFDEKSNRYWSLSNWIPEKFKGHNVERTRNTLALISSPDLRNWTVHKVVLQDDNVDKSGFQYVDWQVEGADMVFVSRTAFFDGAWFADNQHNSNFITFHRIDNFRNYAETTVSEK